MSGDYPDGTTPALPGNTVELQAGFAVPWYQSGTISLNAGATGSFTLSFTDPYFIYFVDMINISPSANREFAVVIDFNGIEYVSAAGYMWLNAPLRQNPSLYFLEGDVLIVTVTNFSATAQTFTVKHCGTSILRPAAFGHPPQAIISIDAVPFEHPCTIQFHDDSLYTSDSSMNFYTYWLYAGAATPEGFELISDVGGMAYHRLLGCGENAIVPAVGQNPDTFNSHIPVFQSSDYAATDAKYIYYEEGHTNQYASNHGWHHSTATVSMTSGSALPLSKSLKLLRFAGIPSALPADIIIPFTVDVPEGFERYSAQDGYYIYCSNDVGTIVGAATHHHHFDYSLTGSVGDIPIRLGVGDTNFSVRNHAHVGSYTMAAIDNLLTSQNIILGKVTSPITVLPVGMILLSTSLPASIDCTSLHNSGSALANKYLFGSSNYSAKDTADIHDHADFTITSVSKTTGTCFAEVLYWDLNAVLCTHGHTIHVHIDDVNQDDVVSHFKPQAYLINVAVDLSVYASISFYGICTRDWDFGDNTDHSEEEEPEHTFTEPGTYLVKLLVTNGYGWDSSYYEVVIT